MARRLTVRDVASIDTAVEPLATADVPNLRLDERARLPEGRLTSLLRAYPDRSVWIPATGEYAVVGPWRHRPELAVIEAITAFRHESVLLHALIARTRASGAAALLLMDSDETRRPAFHDRYGFQPLEEIQTFELPMPARRLHPDVPNGRQRLRFAQVEDRSGSLFSQVVSLDHEAFPWLWWNSEEEFRAYLAMPEVEVWAGSDGDQLLAYVGLTHFPGWGHLDRIAVAPHAQNMGVGREAMSFAIQRVAALGAARMALSTQGDNVRSQRLYASMGFRRTLGHDYMVRGVVFDPEKFRH